MKILSWNVNGIRACYKKGFMDWAAKQRNDVIMLQEVRAEVEQIPPDLRNLKGYSCNWLPARSRRGYSGVAILSKEEPKKIIEGLGIEEFDVEARVIAAELSEVVVVSAYFPNSQEKGRRIKYKVEFCEAMHEWLGKLRKKGKPVVLGGDYNIAHEPIDLARPKQNEGSPGYLPQEREWMTTFTSSGWVDSYRELHPKTQKFSWWSQRSGARERNVGWRIDYHTLHKKDLDRLQKAEILNDVMGSDHCPVTMSIDLS